MDSSWLDRRLTIAEAEAENTHNGIAFGFMNGDWEKLKSQMLEGDELWSFASSMESWRHLAGRAGIVLLREGVEIACLVTRMN